MLTSLKSTEELLYKLSICANIILNKNWHYPVYSYYHESWSKDFTTWVTLGKVFAFSVFYIIFRRWGCVFFFFFFLNSTLYSFLKSIPKIFPWDFVILRWSCICFAVNTRLATLCGNEYTISFLPESQAFYFWDK